MPKTPFSLPKSIDNAQKMLSFYLKPDMTKMIRKSSPYLAAILMYTLLLMNCSNDDDCTKMVNIPRFDPNQGTFVDNFQEVPCDFEEPVTQPVVQ
ncbi:hypothetical protein [Spongiimicrobium salis]|uniref:hypothetical protein n=1 Tax=Spongiimicrobium salis TaxID=1667022 RepID=UPI00374DE044